MSLVDSEIFEKVKIFVQQRAGAHVGKYRRRVEAIISGLDYSVVPEGIGIHA
jgi:hypothetical protein